VSEVIFLHTLSDVVALLKTKEARDNGVEERVFHRNGILSLEGVATELRHRGYEVELFENGGGPRIRLLAVPHVGAQRRKKEQLSFLDPPGPKKPRGTYDEAA
jgi:hypothetical protein